MNKVIIVHSHELNQHGEPLQEYRSRLDHVWASFKKGTHLVLTGWKATRGIDMRHCDAWSKYLRKYWVPADNIHIEVDPVGSKETVLETIYAKRDHHQLISSADIAIAASSDYAKERVWEIYKFVWWNALMKRLRFLGISRDIHGNHTRTPEQEKGSLQAFQNTFAWIPIGDLDMALERLWKNHPVYKDHPSNPYKK